MRRQEEVNPIGAQERQIRKIALENFSVSLMNNTKWREFMEAFQAQTKQVEELQGRLQIYHTPFTEEGNVFKIDG